MSEPKLKYTIFRDEIHATTALATFRPFFISLKRFDDTDNSFISNQTLIPFDCL
jgi:hypothetical protein